MRIIPETPQLPLPFSRINGGAVGGGKLTRQLLNTGVITPAMLEQLQNEWKKKVGGSMSGEISDDEKTTKKKKQVSKVSFRKEMEEDAFQKCKNIKEKVGRVRAEKSAVKKNTKGKKKK